MMGRKIMGETGIKPIVIEEICDLAKKYNVKKVILFGSRARGSFKEKSDIDLAVQGGNFVHFMLDVNEDPAQVPFCALILLIWTKKYRVN